MAMLFVIVGVALNIIVGVTVFVGVILFVILGVALNIIVGVVLLVDVTVGVTSLVLAGVVLFVTVGVGVIEDTVQYVSPLLPLYNVNISLDDRSLFHNPNSSIDPSIADVPDVEMFPILNVPFAFSIVPVKVALCQVVLLFPLT